MFAAALFLALLAALPSIRPDRFAPRARMTDRRTKGHTLEKHDKVAYDIGVP